MMGATNKAKDFCNFVFGRPLLVVGYTTSVRMAHQYAHFSVIFLKP
jgi:hypothetical protein